MKAIKVNADYELNLFGKKTAPPIINHTIEFLSLFLVERPLLSNKTYSSEFLNHIETITGHKPQIVSSGAFENWWGPLADIPLEQKLNSKIFSASFNPDTKIITHLNELHLQKERTYLAKSPFGMSGQDIASFKEGEESRLQGLFSKSSHLIVEPLFEREKDFSHYIFPDGKMICYENLVNSSFQYKGTLFSNLASPTLNQLSFFNEIDMNEWKEFEMHLEKVKEAYVQAGAENGYSIDSFTYSESGKRKIRAVCEVNYRKTMGLMAWMLSRKFAGTNNWSMLVLGKNLKKEKNFAPYQKSLSPIAWNSSNKKGCLLLSPGDTRFEMFFLSAADREEGKSLFKDLKGLLPDCEFSVEI